MINKKYLTIFGMFLLIGIVGAGLFGSNLDFSNEREEALEEKGITAPEIYECIENDEFTCTAKVFQEGGINIEITIDYKYCSEYEQQESNLIDGEFEDTDVCKKWTTMKQGEIETALVNELEERLEKIADVHIKRTSASENSLTDKISVDIS